MPRAGEARFVCGQHSVANFALAVKQRSCRCCACEDERRNIRHGERRIERRVTQFLPGIAREQLKETVVSKALCCGRRSVGRREHDELRKTGWKAWRSESCDDPAERMSNHSVAFIRRHLAPDVFHPLCSDAFERLLGNRVPERRRDMPHVVQAAPQKRKRQGGSTHAVNKKNSHVAIYARSRLS